MAGAKEATGQKVYKLKEEQNTYIPNKIYKQYTANQRYLFSEKPKTIQKSKMYHLF